jgi:hypothetical protein
MLSFYSGRIYSHICWEERGGIVADENIAHFDSVDKVNG